MSELLPTVISIDPQTAVDLDDAIGVRVDGQTLVADICLPDVPAFVPLGSNLDLQAYERGLTQYRVGQIKRPMLSEEVNRHLTLSSASNQMMVWIELRYSNKMELKQVTLRRIRHKTAARLSYDEADNILMTPEHPLHHQMTDLSIFARALHSRRQTRTGALFDIQSGLYTSEDGIVQTLAEQDRYLSHLVVMEFMIAANSALAHEAHKRGAKIIYRNHKPESVSRGDRNTIKAELEQIRGMQVDEAQDHIRHIACTVGAATLGTTSQGHWGLDTPYYAWFSSPLRRYPDIVNLRALLEDVQDPDLEEKAEKLTELFQANGREKGVSMKLGAYRRIFNNIRRGGPTAVDDVNLRTVINALDNAGRANDQIIVEFIKHRIANDNYTVPHLIDLMICQTGVTRMEVLNDAAKIILLPHNLGLTMTTILNQGLITDVILDQEGRVAVASNIQHLLEQHQRPIPEILARRALSEGACAPCPNRNITQKAVRNLYENDAPINSKSKLLEVAAKTQATVAFTMLGRTGPDHEPVFEVELKWKHKKSEIKKRASGRTISLAERYVSRDMLNEVADIEDLNQGVIDQSKHPKSSLLEHAMFNRGKLHIGKATVSGPAHEPQFELTVQYICKIGTFVINGYAGSKKEAERNACQQIVEQVHAHSANSKQPQHNGEAQVESGAKNQRGCA